MPGGFPEFLDRYLSRTRKQPLERAGLSVKPKAYRVVAPVPVHNQSHRVHSLSLHPAGWPWVGTARRSVDYKETNTNKHKCTVNRRTRTGSCSLPGEPRMRGRQVAGGGATRSVQGTAAGGGGDDCGLLVWGGARKPCPALSSRGQPRGLPALPP